MESIKIILILSDKEPSAGNTAFYLKDNVVSVSVYHMFRQQVIHDPTVNQFMLYAKIETAAEALQVIEDVSNVYGKPDPTFKVKIDIINNTNYKILANG